MITTFFTTKNETFLVQSLDALSTEHIVRLSWLLDAQHQSDSEIAGDFVGPRKEIVSPWSTNACDIVQNAGVPGVVRIEKFLAVEDTLTAVYDPMTEALYQGLDGESLVLDRSPEPLRHIESIAAYNSEAGLALSEEEVSYLQSLSDALGRKLTDAEVYAFSQINSEHCRHKIFNGEFVIDGEVMPKSLFALIKETSKKAPEYLVSAYKDNVAFVKGPALRHFSPSAPEKPGNYQTQDFTSVLSLKAETHNFPTTVEPFFGASTGSGGEIRDRMAGGIGSFPLAGTAVYMTSYPRLRAARAGAWEKHYKERDWKYQSPSQILIKASNGASDFGNKFGQPLICGSLLTYEGKLGNRLYAYDRCIMLAGGVGFAKEEHAQKRSAAVGDVVVVIGGDNYRIGMAGGSVSSVDTGALSKELELSAVQRANPEMQKRAANVVRALCELAENPVKLIHDHGAGGHVNCLSELLEDVGGRIHLQDLPLGDPTLSPLELICNESQERMGLLLSAEDVALLQAICERERAPMYVVGEVTGDSKIVFEAADGTKVMDLSVEALFGSSPVTRLEDAIEIPELERVDHGITNEKEFFEALELVLSLESVACKDWLTNKVDRSVTGLVAQQQCVGPLQLPLSDFACMALDFSGLHGVATAIGHAPIVGLIDPKAGAELSVVEALTNLVFAPLAHDIRSVALSANWMWPAKQDGENARLYLAVSALSTFCQELGIAVPTGKDSLSMTMKYDERTSVRAPGTVIVSAMAETAEVGGGCTPALKPLAGSVLLHIDFSGQRETSLGASAFAQTRGMLGDDVPRVRSAADVAKSFTFVQQLLKEGKLLAGHDVSAGGLITCLGEMAFAGNVGIDIAVSRSATAAVEMFFSEKPGVVVQVAAEDVATIAEAAASQGVHVEKVAEVSGGTQLRVTTSEWQHSVALAELRRIWFKPSYLLDAKQVPESLAKERYERFDAHPLEFSFPAEFSGSRKALGITEDFLNELAVADPPIRAAVIREKGTNGEREMAISLRIAGFEVRDVTTTDLMYGRETLEDVHFVVFPGGFSNSDVLGGGRGWAGALRFNTQARGVLEAFFAREDTLSLGVCNGCQLVAHLGVLGEDVPFAMEHNESLKFESCFVGVRVRDTKSIMLQPLVGSQLGIWVAHGEGRFSFKENESNYDVPLTYMSTDYPANPNGSPRNAAALCSTDGRHLVMMPHLERSMFAWNWPYKEGVSSFEVSPWVLAFKAAHQWCVERATS